ncbi:MAG: hypothetical protein HOI95_28345 [Chromatiales bacterium]|nr:hypothetical protein [Chromatiales bacterium]
MNPHAVGGAAEYLSALRTGRQRVAPLEGLPAEHMPADLNEAYAVQEAARTLITANGMGPMVGWKIGCTTQVMRDYLAIAHPCAGTLYAGTVMSSPAQLRHDAFFQLGLECEIAVRLGTDLPHGIAGSEAADGHAMALRSIQTVMTSVEVVEHRFVDFSAVGTPTLVADDFFSAGCVLGEEVPIGKIGDLAALSGRFSVDGTQDGPGGVGAAIEGHPLNALIWLANHAKRRGTPLRAGGIVTLGSVVKTIYPPPNCRVDAAFDTLGTVTVEII